ncbi:CcdB family protein [Alteromonas sp. RW2A1]|uniref:CcdB family protein n=1 Tax=Alteromonas sp. RW2A1 TaxID=1917158 RepID=UPI000903D9EE|nr:CcdB family protein [Alteromonas sp. RW2A1]
MTLTPEIDFDGVGYVFLSQQITTVPIDTFKVAVGTLVESRALLIDAIDFAITGI